MNNTRIIAGLKDRFTAVYPSIAKSIGLNESIVVQELHFLLSLSGGKVMEGRQWVFNTYDAWKAKHFDYWSVPTVKRIFRRLEAMGIVHSCQPDGARSRKKYYRLDYAALEVICGVPAPAVIPATVSERSVRKDQCDPILVTEHPVQNTPLAKESKEAHKPVRDTVPVASKCKVKRREEIVASFDSFWGWAGDFAPLSADRRSDYYYTLKKRNWMEQEESGKWVKIRNLRKYVMGFERNLVNSIGEDVLR